MPELRRDPVTGRWVSLAPARSKRPKARRPPTRRNAAAAQKACPFCPGNEARTPPEVAARRPGGGPANSAGWQVRVVPNLYPAFVPSAEVMSATDSLHRAVPAVGVCEVIINGPDHRRWLPYLSAEQAGLVMSTVRQRYLLNATTGITSIVALCNHGAEAGASLDHPHGQLYATAAPAPVLAAELAGARRSLSGMGVCVFCRMIAEEEAAGARVVASERNFVAIAPWAAREPFELWILPRQHRADFGLISAPRAAELGRFMRAILFRMTRELGEFDVNWYVHSLLKAGAENAAAYHWHVEIRPRLTEVAGFEMATGTHINTLPPEEVAAALRAQPDPGPEEQPLP